MKRMYLMKGMAALAFGLVAVSCNKSDIFNPYAQQKENEKKSEAAFAENVMNGQAIDPNQTWSTANAMEVSVTPSATGTLKIYAANPIGNVVAPLYTANVTAGAQTTFTVTKPADVQALYATVYKAEGQIVNLQAFDATGSKAEVNFNSTTGNRAARRANSDKPSLPNYDRAIPTSTFSTPEEPTGIPTSSNAQNKITASSSNGTYLNGDKTYYIATGVVLSNVTGIGDRCKVYMASGSTIVFTNQASLASGTVIYNDGGTIEFSQGLYFNNSGLLWNKGTVDLKKKDISYSNDNGYIYNSGTIKNVKDFTVGQRGTLWNVGTIKASGKLSGLNVGSKIYNKGNSANDSILVGGLELNNSDQYFWNDGKVNVTGTITFFNSGSKFANNGTLRANKLDMRSGAQFINYADHLVVIADSTNYTNANAIWINNGTYNSGTFSITAGGSQVFNNCRLTVKDKFIMDSNDGSRFVLQGDASVITENFDWNGDNYFWMGGNSLLLVKNKLKSNNDEDDGKGFHQFGENPAVISARVISTDNEEGQGRICLYGKLYVDADSMFTLKKVDKISKNNYVTEGEVTFTRKQFTAQVPDSWKTPTTCRPAYVPQKTVNDQVMYYYYAFEDLGTTNDFDFNDVVIRVSAPINGTSTVQLMCAGGTMSTKVTYGETILCKEVHAAFGVDNIKDMINTGAGPEKTFVTLGTINPPANTDMSRLPFGITCQGNEGQVIRVERSVANNVKAPLLIVVNGYPEGEDAGKWFWPREYINIVNPYEQFGAWGANVQSNANWYWNYTERKDGKVILYKW